MFDQVKVSPNNIINLLKTPERDNSDVLSKKPGNDFFAMVMEKTEFDTSFNKADNKLNQQDKPVKTSDNPEPQKTDYNTTAENTRKTNTIDREENISAKDKSVLKDSEKKEIHKEIHKEVKEENKQESKTKETEKKSEISSKEIKAKKTTGKEADEEDSIINQLHDAGNIKNIMEIIKAAFSGNKKAEEENFQKLFSNIKPKDDKEKTNIASSFRKNDADKNQKNLPELFSSIAKELKESINKEIFKSVENRKSGTKPQILNDKELRELASNIIDSIKKNKAKEIVKHEAKIVLADDVKNEKKQVLSVDQPSLKKIEISDDSSFEKNGSKDKNSGRDNLSYNGAKIDFSAKSGLEKMEHNLKMSDFKENLQEIIDKAKVTVRDSRNGAFTIRLNPQELGNVNVNLILENGVITGKFLVDNEEVKSMLLNSLNDLKSQFEEAGISFGEFSVNVNDQREKYLKQKDDENLKSLSSLNSDRDVIAAADYYNSSSAAHTGHINMVI